MSPEVALAGCLCCSMCCWMLLDAAGLGTAAGCGEVGRGSEVPVHDVPVDVERGNHVPADAVLLRDCHRPVACCGVVQVRLPVSHLPVARSAAGLGVGVRLRAGGV